MLLQHVFVILLWGIWMSPLIQICLKYVGTYKNESPGNFHIKKCI